MIKTRLAPSPTGDPHIGTVFQALLDYIVAKKFNGQFLVRIEDTDRKREVAGAEAAIFSALDWFGLSPDTNQIFRQSERLKIYQEQAQKLIQLGHAYYCFCSSERLTQVREEQTKLGQPPMYDRYCRGLDSVAAAKRSQSEPHVIRLKVPRNQTIVVNDLLRGEVKFDSNIIDDQVLLKSDGWPTYHLAATVDDHLMAITHVIRGEEWLSSAPKHLLIYQFFNWQP
ncbi:glutamate--tRNA ligase, partial [Candidatus Beckwithbacteria bacterium CG23_combo_of_CG06-09_8_20_14_all_47_9]